MSDTPETDAQLTTFTSISKLKKPFVNKTGTVSAQFARGLERERNKLREELNHIKKIILKNPGLVWMNMIHGNIAMPAHYHPGNN